MAEDSDEDEEGVEEVAYDDERLDATAGELEIADEEEEAVDEDEGGPGEIFECELCK